jgi:hypothetical protein
MLSPPTLYCVRLLTLKHKPHTLDLRGAARCLTDKQARHPCAVAWHHASCSHREGMSAMGKSVTPVDVLAAQQVPLSSSSTNPPESESEHAPSPKKRASGLDLLRLAKVSESKPGHLPSYKTGDPRYVHQLFISTREEALALYLEFHPLVQFYQRGDATPECAAHEEIASPLGTPFPIPYTWEDATHTY